MTFSIDCITGRTHFPCRAQGLDHAFWCQATMVYQNDLTLQALSQFTPLERSGIWTNHQLPVGEPVLIGSHSLDPPRDQEDVHSSDKAPGSEVGLGKWSRRWAGACRTVVAWSKAGRSQWDWEHMGSFMTGNGDRGQWAGRERRKPGEWRRVRTKFPCQGEWAAVAGLSLGLWSLCQPRNPVEQTCIEFGTHN